MSGLSFEDNFNSVLKNAKKNLLTKVTNATEKNAYILQANITKGYRDQLHASDYDPLKKETVDRKQKKGLDPRFLIEGDKSKSEDLWKSFEVVKLNDFAVAVGTNAKYARAQEFGYEASGIVARPNVGPALEDSYPAMKENYKEAVSGSFKK
ncbi:HK97 gp10 family phage protein [Leptospira weilii]|uniref:Bacteriophage protein, PF04883 family n=1 Tax=Leptospira weilii str. UI 13098 TaxID=1088542 RepID=M6QFZ6_9LEPT|nr:HK97 gp10 family phage protein [Leptospira weilii]EMN91403.1 bacteriophage protein, PF04883 family [Leptospira weilii str. UI 13098]